jgi:hypothetical protein
VPARYPPLGGIRGVREAGVPPPVEIRYKRKGTMAQCQWDGCKAEATTKAMRYFGKSEAARGPFDLCDEHMTEAYEENWTWQHEYRVICPACSCEFRV